MDYKVDLFTPHEGQRRVIDGFADSEHKFGIVATGRQYGKSLLGQNLLLYWMLQHPKSKGAWISPVYNQARKVFKELIEASNPVITSLNRAELTCTFMNGATLQFLSAERPDSIRGFSFHYMVIDEAAFVKEDGLQEAILPTLTALGKKCLIISTPKGKGNWFYNYYNKGLYENEAYVSFQGPSIENPHVDKTYIEEQRKSLPQDIYAQEYLAEFRDSGNDVFINLELCSNVSAYDHTRQPIYFGVDTGLSSDYSVLCIQNESGRVLNVVSTNGQNITQIAQSFMATLSKYNVRGGYIETNGIGRAMYDLITIDKRFKNVKPFITTQDSKTKAVRKLIADMESGMVEIPSKNLNPTMYNELAMYTYKQGANGKLSFGHPSGMHDDQVDALLLSNLAREELIRGGKIHIGRIKSQPVSVGWGVN